MQCARCSKVVAEGCEGAAQCAQCLQHHPELPCVLCGAVCFRAHFEEKHRARHSAPSSEASESRPSTPCSTISSRSSTESGLGFSETVLTTPQKKPTTFQDAPTPRAPKFVRATNKPSPQKTPRPQPKPVMVPQSIQPNKQFLPSMHHQVQMTNINNMMTMHHIQQLQQRATFAPHQLSNANAVYQAMAQLPQSMQHMALQLQAAGALGFDQAHMSGRFPVAVRYGAGF